MNRSSLLPTSFALSAVALSLFAGCAATALRPGAERVMVTRMPPAGECKFVTTLVGNQGGALDGPFTSNRTLAEGAMNDMKNQAIGAGANYVVLETTTAGNTISGSRNSMSGQQTDVTHVGNAFFCPSGPAPAAVPGGDSQASR